MGYVVDHKPAGISWEQITGFRPIYITLTLPQSRLPILLSIRFFRLLRFSLTSLVWKMTRSRHNPADQRGSDTVPSCDGLYLDRTAVQGFLRPLWVQVRGSAPRLDWLCTNFEGRQRNVRMIVS